MVILPHERLFQIHLTYTKPTDRVPIAVGLGRRAYVQGSENSPNTDIKFQRWVEKIENSSIRENLESAWLRGWALEAQRRSV